MREGPGVRLAVTRLAGEELVTLGRFELPTCGLGNRRSIHLSYRATGAQFIAKYEDR